MRDQGLLPGWVDVALGEVVEVLDSRRVPLNANERAGREGPYAYYGANGQVGTLDDYLFDGDYALLAEDGGYFDAPHRGVAYRATGKFWVNNHAHVLGPLGGLGVSFLVNWLNAIDWMPHVSGTTRLKLNQGQMREVRVSLPPLSEQKRIVAKLDALQAKSDAAKEALDAIPPLLEKFRQSVLAAAFRGDLTRKWREQNPDVEPASELLARIRVERRRRWQEANPRKAYIEPEPIASTDLPQLPQGWSWASVEQLISEPLANGRSVQTDEQGFPVLRLTALKRGSIDLSERKGGAWTRGEAAPFLVAAGDFLVSRGNGSLRLVGLGGLVPDHDDEVAYPDTLIRLRISSELLLPRLLGRLWNSQVVRRQIERSAKTTAGIFKVSQGDLRAIVIPVPPMREQLVLVDTLERLLSESDSWIDAANAMRARCSSLDQSILAKAFRGELVPQDPNDEPAAVLLERIKAERAAASAAPKPKRSKKAQS